MKISIVVSLQVEGVHCWPDCPIDEVSFLKDPHRHIFHIRCWKMVEHADRDIEIIQLQHDIVHYLRSYYYVVGDRYNYRTHNFESRSCEMIAMELIKRFNLSKCEVLEDGENGALVEI